MRHDRLFRGDDETQAFDWQRQARELEVSSETARALYARAIRRAGDLGLLHAEDLYRRWLRDAAAAHRAAPAPAPVPGRQTQVMRDRDRASPLGQRRQRSALRLGELDPGRWTRTMLELDDGDGAAASTGLAGLPGFDEVQRAVHALAAERAPAAARLPPPNGAAPDAELGAAPSSGTEPGLGAPGLGAATPGASLRAQLVAAATTGQGVSTVLDAADPATAAAVLRELAEAYLPGQQTPVLRLLARHDEGAVARLLGRSSSGDPLPGELAARLDPHVGGAAASAARLHTDDAADLIAAAHHAEAVTLGDEVYFARGRYAPGTAKGDALLAHELTHVAQGQRGELTRAAAKGLESGGTLDPAEAEAELRAKIAVIQLHPPAAAPPPLAAPSGQPSSDGERQAKLAAQHQRLALATQPEPAEAEHAAPPPSKPQAAVAHQPPVMKPAPQPASTGNAYIDTFSAPPSRQALSLWSVAGGHATTQEAADQARFDAAMPPLPVALDGSDARSAKGGGASHTPKAAPTAGSRPPAVTATPTPTPPAVTAGATAARAVKPAADPAQLKADGDKAIDALPGTLPDVKTDPGPAPVTDLAGQADPVRVIADHQHAQGESAKALDAEKAKLLAGPGAAQIQPVKVDDKLVVPREQGAGPMPELPTVEGMTKLKGWNLPADAQASFDAEARPRMDASLAQAKAKMAQAELQRDADRTKAVADSHDKVAQAHADADKQQQTKIADTRTQIANHQADTLIQQEAAVKKLDQQSSDKKAAAVGKINDRISADQAKVDADYKGAQQKAEDQKKKGDDEAAKKKKEAEQKKEDKHWWERAADAVVDGIKAIAEEIDKALDAICKAIGDLLDAVKDAACKVIDAARDFVCAALSEFGDWLKSAVTQLIGSVFPELAAKLNQLIDRAISAAKAAVNAIADGLKKAVRFVCDALKGAIDAVIAAFKAAVQAAATFAQALVTGDWKLVARMVLDGILKMLGIDPAAFYALIGEAEDSIAKIIQNPGGFVHNLVDAAKLGFKQFGAHFWDHLKDGVVQWLFGTLAGAGVHMVGRFDVAGVFELVGQILGLTPQRLHMRVAKSVGEQNADRFDFVASYIQGLVMSGRLDHLWEQIHQDMSGLWDVVIGGVKTFLIEKVVQTAIIKLATMWNPAGAIVQLIETAWNVYQWLKMNAYRLFGLLEAVVHSISAIVAGNISGAANAIESALSRLLPVAISLLADLIGLTGIADKIKQIVQKVETMVQNAIDKLIQKVMGLFKGKAKGDDKHAKPDDKADKDGKDDKDAPEVPKSMVEPQVATINGLSPSVSEAIGHLPAGTTTIYKASVSDPKTVTKNLLATHKDAHLDKGSAQLTLSPIHPAALTQARTVEQFGQTLAQQTGVSSIEIHKQGEGHAEVVGSINPKATFAQLVIDNLVKAKKAYQFDKQAFAVHDADIGGVHIPGLTTTLGLGDTQTREYLNAWIADNDAVMIAHSKVPLYKVNMGPTPDALLDPATHPERGRWMTGCAAVPIPTADAERDWELLIVGIRDRKPANFTMVADSLMRVMDVPSGKAALWSGGVDLSDYARSQGCTALEQQSFYKATQGLKLVNDWPMLRPAWVAFSEKYASAMRGKVRVYMREWRADSILVSVELAKIEDMMLTTTGLHVDYHAMEWGDDPHRVLAQYLSGVWQELDGSGHPLPAGATRALDKDTAIHAVGVAQARFRAAQSAKSSSRP
jgi:hypothetical protein